MSNRKGILSFLILTFGITYLAEGILILSGFRSHKRARDHRPVCHRGGDVDPGGRCPGHDPLRHP